jgi:DNA (cytosine-5)-methyltransferase 1
MRTTVAAYYQKQKREIIEDDKLVIVGEDADDEDGDGDEKPIREIHGFTIFDPKHRNEMVTLEALEQDDGVDRQFEAAGFVVPSFVNDEDVGQEEDAEPQYIRLSSILRYTMDYTDENE